MPFWQRTSVTSPTSLPVRPASATERGIHGKKNDISALTQTLLCPTCGHRYDDSKRRRVTYVGCGHVICRKCSRRESRRSNCPLCAAAARKASRVESDIIRPTSADPLSASSSSGSAILAPLSSSCIDQFIPIRPDDSVYNTPAASTAASRRRLPDVPAGLPPRPTSAVGASSTSSTSRRLPDCPGDVTPAISRRDVGSQQLPPSARSSFRSWFRRNDRETHHHAMPANGSGRVSVGPEIERNWSRGDGVPLRRDAVLNGSSASIAVDCDIAASVGNRKKEIASKRTSLILELETDSPRRQQLENTLLVDCPPLPPPPSRSSSSSKSHQTRPLTSLGLFSRSSNSNLETGKQSDSSAVATGFSNRGDAGSPLPKPQSFFRRIGWRQSLRDDATSAGVKSRELPPTPSTVAKTSPALSYFRRRLAAGDVIVPVPVENTGAGITMSKSVSASGFVAVDGLSSLLSTGSRDTGYASIGTTSPTAGETFGSCTSGGASRCYGRQAMYDGTVQNGVDCGYDELSDEDELTEQPRRSVADLRQRFQKPSVVAPPPSGVSISRIKPQENSIPLSGKDHLPDRGHKELPPPPPDVARRDLLSRLSLLLSPDISSSSQPNGAAPLISRCNYTRSVSSPGMLRFNHRSSDRHISGGLQLEVVQTLPAGSDAVDLESPGTDSCDVSGESLAVTFNPAFTPGGSTGRDLSTDSVASLVSTSTGNSISPPSTWRQPTEPTGTAHGTTNAASLQRPHSVNASQAPGVSRDVRDPLSRISTVRMSARSFGVVGTRHTAEIPSTKIPASLTDNFAPLVRTSLHLTQIKFEVPRREASPIFIGREWLFRDIEQLLSSSSTVHKGALIIGGPGSGKTAIIEQLVEWSIFSRNGLVKESSTDLTRAPHNGKGRPPLVTSSSSSIGRRSDSSQENSLSRSSAAIFNQSTSSLSSSTATNEPLRRLASRLVAFHYCQADNNITCTVPEFVHSLAAYLVSSPRLVAYRKHLASRPSLQAAIAVRQCIVDPSRAFVDAILRPLTELGRQGALDITPDEPLIVAVDALLEAEFHEPDYGGTIASFIGRHLDRFPPFIRLLLTTRGTGLQPSNQLPASMSSSLRCISLDGHPAAVRDVAAYTAFRISTTAAIQANVEPTATGCSSNSIGNGSNGNLGGSGSQHEKLASHIAAQSAGCILYAKLVLDLIERGSLVLKSAGYRVLPINLTQVYQLEMNLRFSTTRSFERATALLSVCLASLYPLTAEELKDCVASRYIRLPGGLNDCERVFELLRDLLIRRMDGTFAFFHPTFREWLVHRDEMDNTKFLCDTRLGHALLAFKMSRLEAPLSPDRVIELGHHVLKAHIYKSTGGTKSPVSSRDLQAYWLCLCTESLSAALVSHRNLFSPNVKVSRLLLLAGANPNARTDVPGCAPALCVASRDGYHDVASLLAEFGADIDAVDDNGVPAISHAASQGHVNIIHLLASRGAKVNQIDSDGWYPVIHAAANGQVNAVSFLLQCNWSSSPSRDHRLPTKIEAVQQALVAAAKAGHTEVCKFLISLQNTSGENFNINSPDQLFGETALTAACQSCHVDTVLVLLEAGASVNSPNSSDLRPILCAAAAGDWQVIDALLGTHHGSALLGQTDKNGRTPLMIAALEGHLSIVELLLSKGASVTCSDRDGLTALCWSSLRGQLHSTHLLLERGSDIDHADKNQRTPLHLASSYGHEQVVQCLLDRGADVEHEDVSGTRALDRAISCRHATVVVCFLRKGAKLGPSTWAMAAGKPDIMILLLNKLLDDGNVLYKKNRVRDAAHRYQYALKKLPTEADDDDVFDSDRNTFSDLRVNLMLNLSRCKRKLNDIAGSIDLATTVINMRPKHFEAYYARARARRDDRQYSSALDDITTALSLAPNNRELQRLLVRIEDEMQDSSSYKQPCDTAMSVCAVTTTTTPVVAQTSSGSWATPIYISSTEESAGNPNRHSGIPDIVSETVAGIDLDSDRFKEETAL